MPLPDDLIGALTALRDRIRPDLKASWTHPELMHLTLHFLGDVAPASIAGITAAIQTTCAETPPFFLAARGLGVFPDPRRPRVLWAGIEDAGPLLELQRRLAGPLKGCGVELDSRSYRPHLTLARFRKPPQRQPLSFLRTILLAEQRDFGSVPVREVRLHRSELLPGGPRYTVLSTAPLTRSP